MSRILPLFLASSFFLPRVSPFDIHDAQLWSLKSEILSQNVRKFENRDLPIHVFFLQSIQNIYFLLFVDIIDTEVRYPLPEFFRRQ
jgi:hypothetical protein